MSFIVTRIGCWLAHCVSLRAHHFGRSDVVSDCGLAAAKDCLQLVLEPGSPNESTMAKRGVVHVYVPEGACGLCRRAVRARARKAYDHPLKAA